MRALQKRWAFARFSDVVNKQEMSESDGMSPFLSPNGKTREHQLFTDVSGASPKRTFAFRAVRRSRTGSGDAMDLSLAR